MILKITTEQARMRSMPPIMLPTLAVVAIDIKNENHEALVMGVCEYVASKVSIYITSFIEQKRGLWYNKSKNLKNGFYVNHHKGGDRTW